MGRPGDTTGGRGRDRESRWGRGGGDLRDDDALGIAGTASVDVVFIFGGAEPGRDDIHVSGEHEPRMAHAARHSKNIGALALDGKFARVVTDRAEMAMEEIA